MIRLTAENRRWWLVATMTGAASMVVLDATVVSVALPAIQRDLQMSALGPLIGGVLTQGISWRPCSGSTSRPGWPCLRSRR